MADTTSLAAHFGDATLDRDPAELWIGTVAEFGLEFLGVHARQAHNNIRRLGEQVHRAAGLVITVQSSGDQIRRNHVLHVSESRSKAADAMHGTSHISSGTSTGSSLLTSYMDSSRKARETP